MHTLETTIDIDYYTYALLTIGGLEHIATASLVDDFDVLRSTLLTLPAPPPAKGQGAGTGLGVIMARTEAPLAPQALSSPCVCTALAVVLQCELSEADDLIAICDCISGGWSLGMRTLSAHMAVPAAASYRVASVRIGRHSFDSRALNARLGDAVGGLQPVWTVDLEAPDVCVCCVLVQRTLLIGLLLPPFTSRKSTPLPMEPRGWLVAGVDRPHMRPSRAACLVRLLQPQPGEVLLDPTGGIGLIAIEAALLTAVRAYSIDVDAAACEAARANAAAAAPRMLGTVEVLCADASRLLTSDNALPLPHASIDCVVADLPFGMVHAQRLDVGQLLLALAKLLKPGGRCLLVGNAGPGGVAAAVVKASRRFPPRAWQVDGESSCAAGGIACTAVALTLIATPHAASAPAGAAIAASAASATPAASAEACCEQAAAEPEPEPELVAGLPDGTLFDRDDAFDVLIGAVHMAELADDDAALRRALAAVAAASSRARDAWRAPFATDSHCRDHLLAPCPAAFWRRLSRKFPGATDAIGAACAALADEDLLDLAPPDVVSIELDDEVTIALVEGAYATGGIGRHVYAAATALATLIVRRPTRGSIVPEVRGQRVCELGSGVGLVGLAAARCGAAAVLMTDYSEVCVACAAANAARNQLSTARAAVLDWCAFGSAAGGDTACAAAGMGDGIDGWWPDVILGADCCYSDTMGDALIATIAHLLAAAPPTAKACIVNGWPNRGLERFETLVGARKALAEAERRARDEGEPEAPRRPFVDVTDAGGLPAPQGLHMIRLIAAERITGFADHAHHVYVFERA